MHKDKKVRFYEDNLRLKEAIKEAGITVTELANRVGYHRNVVSACVNGYYKGTNLIPLIEKELGTNGSEK